jgi:hypothetical protein
MAMLAPGDPNRVAIENNLIALAHAGRLAVNMNSYSIQHSAPHWRAQIIASVNNAIAGANGPLLYQHRFHGNLTVLPAPPLLAQAAAAAELFESEPCADCGEPQGGRWYRRGHEIVIEGV